MPNEVGRAFRRKHYLLIQNALKEAFSGLEGPGKAVALKAATQLANLFQQDSRKFNREKFIEGCGL
jgi:hypothetical protein